MKFERMNLIYEVSNFGWVIVLIYETCVVHIRGFDVVVCSMVGEGKLFDSRFEGD